MGGYLLRRGIEEFAGFPYGDGGEVSYELVDGQGGTACMKEKARGDDQLAFATRERSRVYNSFCFAVP